MVAQKFQFCYNNNITQTHNRKDSQMAQVTILNGMYGKKEVKNVTFPLVKQLAFLPDGQGYVTVDGSAVAGYPERQLRIKVDSINDYVIAGVDAVVGKAEVAPQVKETDEQIMDRLRERFSILDEMTQASVDGVVRAMIVSGPPGVGKSYGVEQVLEKNALFDKLANKRVRFEVVKGAMSAKIGRAHV